MKNARNNIRPLASPAMPVNAQYNQSFFFSSDTVAGAQNVSSDGTRFSVQLADPIAIPDGALTCELGVVTASIWNNSPNIGAGLGPAGVDNNKFQYTTSTAPAGTYSTTLPTGLLSGGNLILHELAICKQRARCESILVQRAGRDRTRNDYYPDLGGYRSLRTGR